MGGKVKIQRTIFLLGISCSVSFYEFLHEAFDLERGSLFSLVLFFRVQRALGGEK